MSPHSLRPQNLAHTGPVKVKTAGNIPLWSQQIYQKMRKTCLVCGNEGAVTNIMIQMLFNRREVPARLAENGRLHLMQKSCFAKLQFFNARCTLGLEIVHAGSDINFSTGSYGHTKNRHFHDMYMATLSYF